jgi:hypothetical protein
VQVCVSHSYRLYPHLRKTTGKSAARRTEDDETTGWAVGA